MPNKCFVNNCTSDNKKEKGIAMFRPPVHPQLFSMWQKILKDKTNSLKYNSRICEKHFRPDQVTKEKTIKDPLTGNSITKKLPRAKLQATAVPSVFNNDSPNKTPKKSLTAKKKKSKYSEDLLNESVEDYHKKLQTRPRPPTPCKEPKKIEKINLIKKKLKIILKKKPPIKSSPKISPVISKEPIVPIIRVAKLSTLTNKTISEQSKINKSPTTLKNKKKVNPEILEVAMSDSPAVNSISIESPVKVSIEEVSPTVLEKPTSPIVSCTIENSNEKEPTTSRNKKEMILCVKISVKKPEDINMTVNQDEETCNTKSVDNSLVKKNNVNIAEKNKLKSHVENQNSDFMEEDFPVENEKMDAVVSENQISDFFEDNTSDDFFEKNESSIHSMTDYKRLIDMTRFLYSSIQLPDKSWAQTIHNGEIFFTKLTANNNAHRAFIEKQIVVKKTGEINIYVLDKLIKLKNGNPDTIVGLSQLIMHVNKMNVCVGVPQLKENVSHSSAYRDQMKTWRHLNCDILVESKICEHCNNILNDN